MTRLLLPGGLAGVLLVLGVMACTSDASDERSASGDSHGEEAELAVRMAQLQRWTHKATLALQARNGRLGAFYLHEMEESVESIQDEVPTYEGYAIEERTEKLLVPSVEALEDAFEERDWSAVDRRLSDLERSCNQCHQTTDHGFIVIDLEDVPNPYPQDFAPPREESANQ